MGCDGGTIPRRDELVRQKKKPEQKDKQAELSFKWRHCTLTQEKLQQPIVVCGLGRFYNKESLIEALISGSVPDLIKHIKNLKDVKDIKFHDNPAYKPDINNFKVAPHICPVTGLEMNGNYRFVFLWNCGCVFSERALKQIKTNTCVMCQKSFVEDDVVVLNGTDEDTPIMMQRHLQRRLKLKAGKKSKEIKTEVTVKEEVANNVPSTSTSSAPVTSIKLDVDVKAEPTTSGSTGRMTKAAVQNLKRSLQKQGEGLSASDPLFKKAKDSYSVAKDPNASGVYKSLFTTHESEKKQERAHWVTYNPFYN